MASGIWKKYTNIRLGNSIRFAKASAGIEVSNADGSTTTVSPAEIKNLDGNTASGAEISRVADASARVVTTTATALSLTAALHADRVVLINTNSTADNTFTLPEATGTGNRYEIRNNIAQTQGTIVIAALTTDVLDGRVIAVDTTAVSDDVMSWATSATSDKISLDLTTTGGLRYDTIKLLDAADATWLVEGVTYGSGDLATPFSAT